MVALLCILKAYTGELPIINDSDAIQYVGKTVEVRGIVASVDTSPLGTAVISFGKRYPNQSFAGFVVAGSKMAGDERISWLEGRIISIIGAISMREGKPEIEITSPEQVRIISGTKRTEEL